MSKRCLRPRVIAFAGPVGAGKSTQMRYLARGLKNKGLRTNTTFLKTGHLLAYALEVALTWLLTGSKSGIHPTRILIENRLDLFRVLFRIWATLDLISINMRFLFTVYIPVRLGRIVLVEEYIPAAMADYLYFGEVAGLPNEAISFVLKPLQRLLFLAGPTQVIFLDADVETLKDRWRLRESAPERSDYISMQRTVLLSILKKLSSCSLLFLFYMDTTRETVGYTHELILSFVDRMI